MKYNYNKDKEEYLEAIAAGEEIEHMLVSFDENYNVYVSNKRFTTYLNLDEKKTYNILDFIHPEDADRFKRLVKDGEKHDGGEVVRVKADKDYRSCLVTFNSYNTHEKGYMNEIFEFIDIVQAVARGSRRRNSPPYRGVLPQRAGTRPPGHRYPALRSGNWGCPSREPAC